MDGTLRYRVYKSDVYKRKKSNLTIREVITQITRQFLFYEIDFVLVHDPVFKELSFRERLSFT